LQILASLERLTQGLTLLVLSLCYCMYYSCWSYYSWIFYLQYECNHYIPNSFSWYYMFRF